MQTWRIIYPGGDRTRLSMALVFDYEENDWDLASQRRFQFEEESECREYMIELAHKNDLRYDGDNNSAYLD